MKTSILLAAALLFCSGAARAADDPQWSVGAGVGFFETGTYLGSTSGYLGQPILLSPQTVTPVLSLERRVAPGTWLLLGLAGNFSRTTSPLPLAGTNNYGSFVNAQNQGGASLAIGARHYLTEPGTIVGVSVQGAVTAGFEDISADYATVSSEADGTSRTTLGHGSATAWAVGALGGIALDKHLLDQLTLRLAVSLLSVDYTKTTTSSPQVGGASTGFGASLTFNPDLELRFAF